MPVITHLFKTYFPNTQGGLEEAIRQIGKYSIKNGFDVRVVSVSKNPVDFVLDGIRCKSFYHNISNSSMPFSFSLIKDFKKIIEETDILHLHFPWPEGELLTLLFNIKKPFIITFHCDIHNREIIRFFYTPFLKALFRKTKIIVPTSTNLLNSSKILSDFKDKCIPINLWLDSERFDKMPEPDLGFKDEISLFGDYCLFVGVLRWYKGLSVLLESAKKIKGNIVIVGKGPLYNKLKSKVENENIKNVFLLGFQSDDHVKYLLQKSSFVVLPSISPAEAFGQILLEASFFNKPMISTELGTGTSYVNINNNTGFVIAPNNSDQLANACNNLFMNNNLASEWGKNAYNRYKNYFSEEIQGQKYIEIYKSLLK